MLYPAKLTVMVSWLTEIRSGMEILLVNHFYCPARKKRIVGQAVLLQKN